MHDEELNYFASNFKFSDIDINRIVYNVCISRKIEHFFHYVSRNDENEMLDLEEMFYTIHYAEIGYLTDKHYAQRGVDILPFFILTDKYMIKFDEEAENAYVFEAAGVMEFMVEKLHGVKRRCRQHVYLPENAIKMMGLMDSTLSENTDDETIGMDNTMCPAYLTPEIALEIASDYVKQNPVIVSGLFAHYKLMLGDAQDVDVEQEPTTKIIVTHEAITNFIKTGRIDSLPLSLAGCVSRSHTADMLEKMYTTPESKYMITNDVFFKTDYPFAFQIKNRTLNFVAAKYPFDLSDPNQYVGDIFYLSEDERIVSAFTNFLQYFANTEKVHTLSASTNLLNSYVNTLRG